MLLYLTSCTEELNQPAPQSKLDFRVVNSQNQPVPNAEVKIYKSAIDWRNEKNAITKSVTNASGKVQLTGINVDSLWVKATWIDLNTREVYQNTLTSFKPIKLIPNSQSTYQIKINSAKVLKGILIKKVDFTGYIFNNCDQSTSYNRRDIRYCGGYSKLYDISGPACDLYLLIENSTSVYSNYVNSYFYRSPIQVDVPNGDATFTVNDTITDFRKPYYIGVREHIIVNPDAYAHISCSSNSNLGAFLASKDGQEYVIKTVDQYIITKKPLLNLKDSALPPNPAEEVDIKLYSNSKEALKLHLEWIYR